ncbi:hypothetical protein [Domibacillus sp.]|uniref:hypothetical protein n=1 Tax=Domibacillus sp. TaxID=1969783 RepID=UPI00281112D9|nr:hypothetical protein [Domibacillus sp.]
MMPIDALRAQLETLKQLPIRERMFEFAGLVTEYMSAFSIKPVVVGGLAVELYTLNHYTTHDIDFISSGWEQFNKLLTDELAFKRTAREWYHEELEIAIEIPSSDLEGSAEKVVEIELKSGRSIFVIAVEDIIIHRLESVLVSNVQFPEDHEDYQWAYRMFLLHKDDLIDHEYLKQESLKTKTNKWIQDWIKTET